MGIITRSEVRLHIKRHFMVADFIMGVTAATSLSTKGHLY